MNTFVYVEVCIKLCNKCDPLNWTYVDFMTLIYSHSNSYFWASFFFFHCMIFLFDSACMIITLKHFFLCKKPVILPRKHKKKKKALHSIAKSSLLHLDRCMWEIDFFFFLGSQFNHKIIHINMVDWGLVQLLDLHNLLLKCGYYCNHRTSERFLFWWKGKWESLGSLSNICTAGRLYESVF